MTGMTWREAGAFGLLMNTRGLMELVIAGVGLELGIITEAVFAMLVLMAIVTTFAATPLLECIYPEAHRSKEEDPAVAEARTAGSPAGGVADAG